MLAVDGLAVYIWYSEEGPGQAVPNVTHQRPVYQIHIRCGTHYKSITAFAL